MRLRKECGVAGSDWLSAGPVIWFNDAPTAYFAAMMDPKLTAAPTHVCRLVPLSSDPNPLRGIILRYLLFAAALTL